MGLMIDTVRLAMGVEEAKARIAAHNIAMASVPGSKAMQLNVAPSMAMLRGAQSDPFAFAQALRSLQATEISSLVQTRTSDISITLDSEVADMSAASGRYSTLAEGVSRQFALMQLAIRGGR
jgi:flagellar basal body rod protein FlgB